MITITFPQSRSKNYKETMKYALFFKGFRQENSMNILELPLREIIEKWEWFNLVFWFVVDWRGTTVNYENITYYSHSDKTAIFYALQQIHSNYTTSKLVTSYKTAPIRSEMLKVDPAKLSNEQVDHLIDVMMIKINSRKQYENKIKDIEKKIKEGI